MDWEEYEANFQTVALKEKRSNDYIQNCLTYARKLYDQNLPIIYDAYHLSKMVGYDLNYVFSMTHAPQFFYRSFEIKKKSGGFREINEPLPDLKRIQSWILNDILNEISISPYAKAYVSGRSIKDNARYHRKQACLLTLDIHDFFGSIPFFKIREIYISLGYSADLSTVLANLSSFQGKLPQGAPTSAYLSNIFMKGIDHRLGSIAQHHNWRYTRYADDISFSGNIDIGYLLNEVHTIVKENGLSLNPQKTRIARPNTRQVITGIVVNQKMQIPKEKRKFIRQQLYYIQKYGLDSHLSHIKETRKNYLDHLIGSINQALFINSKDIALKKYKNYLLSLIKERNDLS